MMSLDRQVFDLGISSNLMGVACELLQEPAWLAKHLGVVLSIHGLQQEDSHDRTGTANEARMQDSRFQSDYSLQNRL